MEAQTAAERKCEELIDGSAQSLERCDSTLNADRCDVLDGGSEKRCVGWREREEVRWMEGEMGCVGWRER
jgi:hypothetical protein